MEWLGEEGEVELESLLFPDAFLLSVMVTNELITYHITKSEINRVSVNIISFKGTLSLKIFPPYMKDITLLNIINKVKISFSPPFTPKIGDLAEIVRLEGPKKTGNSLL